MRARLGLVALTVAAGGLTNCGSEPQTPNDNLGEAEVALTNAPTDVSCLRLTVAGSRTDVRKFPLTSGQRSVFRLNGLPTGNVSFTADAFPVSCNQSLSGVSPTWFSEPVAARLNAREATHVALAMIHNGRASVGVDFDNDNAPTAPPEPPLAGGTFSSAQPYLVPVETGVRTFAILTVGDSPNLKPDGVTPYRMVGIPDGTGAFDNGDGTFTWLVNHELGVTQGIARAHGAVGAFVSKWIIRKADLAVMHGSDLIQQVVNWNPMTSSYNPPTTGTAFGRFCAGDLPEPSALFNPATGNGFDGLLYFNGEENGDEGRGFAHGLDGVTWDLPRTGKFSWENSLVNAGTGDTTVLLGTDDSGGGQLYLYKGTKTSTGTPIEKAGFTNGTLYGVRVPGFPLESGATGIPTSPFELYNEGNVENLTGAALQAQSVANNVTGFQRPEDGAWDPNNPNHFYFVTTASFATASRLWVLRFVDAAQPELGGTIEMLLDGSEGQRMLDNMTIDLNGRIYMQEDPGGQAHIAKVWRYDIATDTSVIVAQHNPVFFDPTSASFLTNDEESSGIIDASNLLGPGWFLLDVQAHYAIAGELVQGGQLLAMFDPAAAGG